MKSLITALILLNAAAALAASPADKCEAGKNKIAGTYYSCMQKAQAAAISKGELADYSKCVAKFDAKWNTAEIAGAGACPDNLLTAEMNARIEEHSLETALLLAGARFDASGVTIIDYETGLEWEKKDSSGGGLVTCLSAAHCPNPHDVDNKYSWNLTPLTGMTPNGTAFTAFLAQLNGFDDGLCYAGNCDWRLPSTAELSSLPWPAVSEFLPDAAGVYSTISTFAGNPTGAAFVDTLTGIPGYIGKDEATFVRAVRTR
jgi:hypothetical protein